MSQDPGSARPSDSNVAEELRRLGQSLAALARSAFQGGRAISVELLRAIREVVDRARAEIERLTAEKK